MDIQFQHKPVEGASSLPPRLQWVDKSGYIEAKCEASGFLYLIDGTVVVSKGRFSFIYNVTLAHDVTLGEVDSLRVAKEMCRTHQCATSRGETVIFVGDEKHSHITCDADGSIEIVHGKSGNFVSIPDSRLSDIFEFIRKAVDIREDNLNAFK